MIRTRHLKVIAPTRGEAVYTAKGRLTGKQARRMAKRDRRNLRLNGRITY